MIGKIKREGVDRTIEKGETVNYTTVPPPLWEGGECGAVN